LELPDDLIEEITERVTRRVIETLNQDTTLGARWMSITTAAEYLDCPVERLRKLVQRRAIPFNQEAPNTRVFFDRHALDRWMESKAA
jgi:excisionase family DNA binding protein